MAGNRGPIFGAADWRRIGRRPSTRRPRVRRGGPATRCALVSISAPLAASPVLGRYAPRRGDRPYWRRLPPTRACRTQHLRCPRRRFELFANELADADSDRLLRDDFDHSIAERNQHQPARQNVIDAEALHQRQAPQRHSQHDRRHEKDRENRCPILATAPRPARPSARSFGRDDRGVSDIAKPSQPQPKQHNQADRNLVFDLGPLGRRRKTTAVTLRLPSGSRGHPARQAPTVTVPVWNQIASSTISSTANAGDRHHQDCGARQKLARGPKDLQRSGGPDAAGRPCSRPATCRPAPPLPARFSLRNWPSFTAHSAESCSCRLIGSRHWGHFTTLCAQASGISSFLPHWPQTTRNMPASHAAHDCFNLAVETAPQSHAGPRNG